MKCMTPHEGYKDVSCRCGCHRQFFTKEEQIEKLTAYKEQLKKEIEGVETEIQRLQQ